MPTPHDFELMRAAFRDVHAARLHGFALLVTRGDRPAAASAASHALDEGMRHIAELRHPERAAAWLRASVVRGLGRRRLHAPASVGPLAGMGVDDALLRSLRALSLRQRAAIIASAVEGFDALDVATILGTAPAGARRAVAEARRRFLATAADAGEEVRYGPLADRVLLVAARGFSPRHPRVERLS